MTTPKQINMYNVLEAQLKRAVLEKGKHDVRLGGYEFVVLPGVFPADFPEDLKYWGDHLAANVPKPHKTEFELMEMGSGSGWFGSFYYLCNQEKMKRVIAVDINPKAVENTKLNFEKHGINGEVILSDLFENLDCKRHKADMIYANFPWVFLEDDRNIDILMRAIADPGYQIFKRFFKDVFNYLKPNGKIVLMLGPDIADIDTIESIAKENNRKLVKIYMYSGSFNVSKPATMPKAIFESVLPLDVAEKFVKEGNPKVELFEVVKNVL